LKAKRLAFTKQYEQWDEARWSKVLFSDESTIQQLLRENEQFVGERFNDHYTPATVKHPPSMIWGAVSNNGTAGHFFLPTGKTKNGVRYHKMLEDKLEIHMTIHECNIFMHDGTLCHRSKLVSDFLQKKNMKMSHWPGNSQDLNPIENLWAILKDKVAAGEHPTSVKDLEMAIKHYNS